MKGRTALFFVVAEFRFWVAGVDRREPPANSQRAGGSAASTPATPWFFAANQAASAGYN